MTLIKRLAVEALKSQTAVNITKDPVSLQWAKGKRDGLVIALAIYEGLDRQEVQDAMDKALSVGSLPGNPRTYLAYRKALESA